MKRHQARIVTLQALYERDVQGDACSDTWEALLEPLLAEAGLSGEAARYAQTLTAGTWAARDRIDQMIAGASEHWDVRRMAVVDRNILRLALYELLEQVDVPVRVVFDEAIELGRAFGATQTPQFVNGVLDAIWKRDPACQAARAASEQPAGSSTGPSEPQH